MPSTTATRAPARQVAGFIAKFDPKVAGLARRARAALRRKWPTANELVYDSYNALAIGFSATERTSDVIVSLAIYAKGVNLYFMYGAMLTDVDTRGLLLGRGNQGRFIRLTEVAELDDPHVNALLAAAVREGDVPLPATGRGRTIVKSVSARQRPRR